MTELTDAVSFDPANKTIITYRSENDFEEFKIYKEEYIYEVISKKIKQVREERSLTCEELGRMVGETKKLITIAENNCKDIEIKTLCKILEALDFKIKIILH